MSGLERRAVAVLASVYALRIFGLFLILPVFALYATGLSGHSPALIGLAMGIYGLTQAALQIPFGVLSDRFGRKPLILIGLIVFAVGSVVAARADTMLGVTLGRALQGAGAIPAVVMALLADLTRDEQRTKAMAFIGGIIGAAFVASIVISPVLSGWVGVPGIFWLTAGLAVVAMPVVWFGVPTPLVAAERSRLRSAWPKLLRDSQLWRLNASIFILHLLLTALFVAVPVLIVRTTGLGVTQHWQLYLPNMLAALLTMIPFIVFAHRRRQTAAIMRGAIAVLILAAFLLWQAHATLAGLIVGLWLFFSAFNLLEAILPASISRLAPPATKGAAMGMYSTAQFLGAFVGGVAGGTIAGGFGPAAVFAFGLGVSLVWLAIAYGLREPPLAHTHLVRLTVAQRADATGIAKTLHAVPGVTEAVVLADEGVAYIKVDPAVFDTGELKRFTV